MRPDLSDRELVRRGAAVPAHDVDVDAVLRRADQLVLRRRATLAAAIVVLLVPASLLALGVLRGETRFLPDAVRVTASLPSSEDPPAALADGSAPAPAPPGVAARFTEPVVGTQRLDEPFPEACGQRPATADHQTPLWDGAQHSGAFRGPDVTVHLGVGEAPAPPGWPDAYAILCWPGGTAVQHRYEGWVGLAQTTGGPVWFTLVQVPPGATSLVHERPGWWLHQDVRGLAWTVVVTPAPPGGDVDDTHYPGARVVFLDATGAPVEDRALPDAAIAPDAPMFASQAAPARMRLGSESAVRERLRGGPWDVCADDVDVCVWVVDDAGTLRAFAAAGPNPLDVPPLGEVVACADRGFAGSTTGARYGRDGRPPGASPQQGLHRYDVAVVDGEVVVDLARFSFGEATADGAPLGPCANARRPRG